jgi:hypothetical protein
VKNKLTFISVLLIILIVFIAISWHDKKIIQPMITASAFSGSWQLISRIDNTSMGNEMAENTHGSNPVSRLMYDNYGHMSVQLMKRDRSFGVENKDQDQNLNNSSAVNGYDAYFGDYLIDTNNHQITHSIIGSINQKDVGKKLIRNYSISGDTLKLWYSTMNSNVSITRTLTWVRESHLPK